MTITKEYITTRYRTISFGADVYRYAFIFVLTCRLIPSLAPSVDSFINNIIIPWGFIILLCDIISKRGFYKMKQVWILLSVLLLFLISIIINFEYFNINIKEFKFWVVFMLVLCPPDDISSIQDKYKIVMKYFMIFIVPVTIMTLLSLWVQINQTSVTIGDYIHFEYAQYYHYRYIGIYSNQTHAGMVSYISIAFLIIGYELVKQIYKSRSITIIYTLLLVVALPLHLTMLTLSGSRTAQFSLYFFIFAYSFLALHKLFKKIFLSIVKNVIISIVAATIITGTVFSLDYPIRVGIANLQVIVANTDNKNAGNNKHTFTNIPGISMTNTLLFNYTSNKDLIEATASDEPQINIIERPISSLDSGRFFLWMVGYEIIKQYPLFGVSPGALTDKSLEVFQSKNEHNNYTIENFIWVVNAAGLHNVYVDIAATIGIPAMVLFIVFLLLYFVRNLKLLFIKIDSSVYPVAGGLFVLCTSLVLTNLFDSFILYACVFLTVIFWSCLSFTSSLLQHDTNKL